MVVRSADEVRRKVFLEIVNSGLGTLGTYDGQDFLIVRDWDTFRRILYLMLKEVIPEAIDRYYRPESLIVDKPFCDGEVMANLHLKVGDSVPSEVWEAFFESGFDGVSLDSLLGIQYGFADEYATCDYCDTVIRTKPDSYSWMPEFIEVDEERICGNCADDDDMRRLVESISNNPRKALYSCLITDGVLTRLGYEKVLDDLNAGIGVYHYDDPEEIYEEMQRSRPGTYVFKIDSCGQFDVVFSLWRKKD